MVGKSLGRRHASWQQRFLVAAVVATMLTLIPIIALAHPLGNFTINRYSHITVSQAQLDLEYVMDAAEIPTYQAMPLIDINRDGIVDEAENAAYVSDQYKRLTPLLAVVVDGTPLVLEPMTGTLEMLPGQASLPTLRLTLYFNAAIPNGTTHTVEYRNDTFSDNLGWREIVVTAEDGVTVANSSALRESVSDELRTYPEDMLQAPLAVDVATFDMDLATGATTADTGTMGTTTVVPAGISDSSVFGKATDGFAELITRPLDTPLGFLAVLALSFVLGAAHALTPGHGKTIVGAYLVGSRGTAKHAAFLGLTTTVTHTAGVFALGAITLFLSRYILPEQLYPWLGTFSGLMVVAIGMSMFRQRFRALTDPSYVDPHQHDNADLHDHEDGDIPYQPHTHTPQNGQLTWRSLLALGVTGGLLPCPSALVLLLSAIALERVGIGLVLIIAFSIGLASVLTGIGLLMVYATRVFNKLPTRGPVFRVVPVLSALFIMGAGALITWQAVAQTGVLPAMSLLAR